MIADLLLSPNDQAQRLIGRDYLSWSSISCWQQCPLKCFFRYIANLPEEFISSSLAMGSSLHSAIQCHYEHQLAHVAPPGMDVVMDAFDQQWRTYPQERIRFSKGETPDSLRSTASRILQAFRADSISRLDGTLLGVEEEIRGPLFDDCPDLLARVDLIADCSSELLVIDFKSSRSRWSDFQSAHNAGQLLLYRMLLGDMVSTDKPIRLLFVVLTKTKSPEIQRFEINVSTTSLARQLQILRRVWQSIRRQQIYPVPSATNCSGCPY